MRVTTAEQLLQLLDARYTDRTDWTSRAAASHWEEVFHREGHPLSSDLPDVNLIVWRRTGVLGDPRGRTALDVGCGLGRNSRWLASQGFTVTGADIAPYAIEEAARRSQGQPVTYMERDFIREDVPGAPFDLVYDSGCFHHLAPHRRISYMRSLDACLVPGGLFGICAFAAGRMGTDAADEVLLRQGRLDGGVGYTTDELREMFSWLEVIDVMPMPGASAVDEPAFSQDFLNVALYRKHLGG